MGGVTEARSKAAANAPRGGPKRRGDAGAMTSPSLEAEQIVERGGIGEEGEVLYLIKWAGLAKAQATWVPRSRVPRDLLDAFEAQRPLAPALAEAEAKAARRARKRSRSPVRSRGNDEADNMAEVAADTARPPASAEARAEGATDGEADSAGEGEVVEERKQPQGRGEAGQGQQGVGQAQGAGADQEQGTSAGAGEDAGLGAGEGDAPAGQSGGRDGVNGEDSGEDGEDGGSQEETSGKAGDTAEGSNENDGNGGDTGGEQSEGANAEGGEAEAQAGAGSVREFHGQEGDSTDGIPASAIKAQVTTGSWTGRKWFQVLLLGADNKEKPIVVRKRKQGTSYRYTQHLYLPTGVEMEAVTATGFTLGCEKCQWDPVGYHNRGGRCACTGCSGCRHMLLGCERCRHRLGPRRPRTRQRRSKMSKGLCAPGERSGLSDYPAMATLPRAENEDQVWARPKGGNVDRHINRGRMERAAAKSAAKATADMATHNHEYRMQMQHGGQAVMGAAYGLPHGLPNGPLHGPPYGLPHGPQHGPPPGHPYEVDIYGHPGQVAEPPYHVDPRGLPHGQPYYAYAHAVAAPHGVEMSQMPHVRVMVGDPCDPRMPYAEPHLQPHPGQQPRAFPSSASDMHIIEPGLTSPRPMGNSSSGVLEEQGREASSSSSSSSAAGAGADADAKREVTPIKKEEASSDAAAKDAAVVRAAGEATDTDAVNLLANLAQAASKMDDRAKVGREAVLAGTEWRGEHYLRYDPRHGPVPFAVSQQNASHAQWSVEGSCWDSQEPNAMSTTSYWMCGGGAVPPPVWSPPGVVPGVVSRRTREIQGMDGNTGGELEGAREDSLRLARMVEGAVVVDPRPVGLVEGSAHANYATQQAAMDGSQRKRMREEDAALQISIHDGRAPPEYDELRGYVGYEHPAKIMRYDAYGEPAMGGYDAPPGHHPDMAPMDSAHYPQGPPVYYAGHGDERLYHLVYPHPGQQGEMRSPSRLQYQAPGYEPTTSRGSQGYGAFHYAPGPGYHHQAQYDQPPTSDMPYGQVS